MKINRSRTGFTIVELLIVIIVIAILAVITIVAFNGMQSRAKQSSLVSSLNQAKKKLDLYKVDYGAYPTTGNLASAGLVNANNTTYQYSSDGVNYCVTASTGGSSYNVTNTALPTNGACSGQIAGGIATNLITNPGMSSGASGYYAWPGGNGAITGARVAAGWATRGYAYRSTYTAANNTSYQGTNGWNIPSSSTQSSAPIALEGGTQYAARWKVRSSISQRIRPDFVNERIANGANYSGSKTTNSSSGDVVIPANTTIEQWIVFTTGADTIAGYLSSNVISGSGASYWNIGDYWEVGDMIIVKGGQPPAYADGDSDDWSWNGSVNNSTSKGPAT